MTRRPRPAHTPSQSAAVPHHENVQQSRAQARSKTIDFLSESEDDPEPAYSSLRKIHHNDESDDEDTDGDSEDMDEEDIDAPRVAQWIDDEEFDLQDQTNDTSPGLDSEGADDDEHSASEAGPSRRLVSTLCVIRLYPFADLHTFVFVEAISRSRSACLLSIVV